MSCCNKIQPAVITPVLAAGSAASPYFVQVNITQKLRRKTCKEITPVFAPRFSVRSFATVGTNQYVATIHVEGIISYTPCNSGCSSADQQPLSQDFTIPFSSATAVTSVTVAAGSTVNLMASTSCQDCSRMFVSETPLTLTVA